MRAVTVDSFGAAPTVTEVDRPHPGPTELLVRIEAAGINPFDNNIANGFLKDHVPHQFPLILGTDGAGVVTEVGPEVTRFHVGDRVVGKFFAPPLGRGTFAEYAVLPEDAIVTTIPDNMSSVEAAALPVAGITAEDLDALIGSHDGTTVLINGAAGGVGSYLVQLAAGHGAHVIATARGADADRMRSLGAAEVLDYTESPVLDQVRAAHPDGVEVLIDLVGDQGHFHDLLPVVRRGGAAWSSIWSADESDMAARGLDGGNFESSGGADVLARLVREVADGDITPAVGREVKLEQVPAVLADPAGARGKTVAVI
ncbi:NADP-dependent oxidoreductase [Nocardia arthritidis]|uniref:Zinc-binding dehydrogenase n=1 Tax=Nocardia arthritidis TaxID=228602 RepID=A0A6G9YL41_9NOCA|nr:NADP-dependent oxidoreductase [Nocardia arthritidis]QIS13989.1 zinc-binding dehydrogenase [Nocardia arthritidis]